MHKLLAVAALMIVGCADAATLTLGPSDATVDAGLQGAVDAAGPLDAAVSPGDCNLGVVSLVVQPMFGANPPAEERVVGRATVMSWWPALALRFQDGRIVRLDARLVGADWPAAPRVTEVDAEVVIRRPFWSEAEASVRAPELDYALTVWSHSRQELSVGPERPSFFMGACVDNSDGCLAAAPLHMNFSLPGGDVRFIPVGARLEEVGLTVVNAGSRGAVGAPRCADVPTVWTAGFIERR